MCGHQRSTWGSSIRPENRPSAAGSKAPPCEVPDRSSTASTRAGEREAASPPIGRTTQETSRSPLPATRLGLTRTSSTETTDRASMRTSPQGPTAAAAGDHPGVRPRSVVRTQRSCWCSIIGARQRGRGRRAASVASSARNRISRSFSASRRRPNPELVRQEHVVARQDQRAVQPDVGKRREPVEAERELVPGRGPREAGAIPPLLRVEPAGRPVERPLTRTMKRRRNRHGAGHRNPSHRRALERLRAIDAAGRNGAGAPIRSPDDFVRIESANPPPQGKLTPLAPA